MTQGLNLTEVEGRCLTATTTDGVTAADLSAALAGALEDGAVVLGWSSSEVSVGRLVEGRVVGTEGRPVPTSDWFGARAFDGRADARWNLRASVGTLVVVREAEGTAGVTIDARLDGVRYLVFGERDRTADGWAHLSAANVGSLAIPDPGGSGRIAIEAVEYVVFDEDGNADVVDELLVGLVSAEVQ